MAKVHTRKWDPQKGSLKKKPKKKGRKTRLKPGMQLGHLHVIQRVRTPPGSSGGQRWRLECNACGGRITLPTWYLVRPLNPRRDCGCVKANAEDMPTRERGIWYMMHRRCYNPTHVAYKHYGGANPPVTVCDRWNKDVIDKEEAFTNFISDMGKAPTPNHTLDRIDPYGSYAPENCRWATAVEQMNNLKRHWPHPDMRAKVEELAKASNLAREVLGDEEEEDDE